MTDYPEEFQDLEDEEHGHFLSIMTKDKLQFTANLICNP